MANKTKLPQKIDKDLEEQKEWKNFISGGQA